MKPVLLILGSAVLLSAPGLPDLGRQRGHSTGADERVLRGGGGGVFRKGHDDNPAEIEIGDYESGRAEC